jgi:hypothetical protein
LVGFFNPQRNVEPNPAPARKAPSRIVQNHGPRALSMRRDEEWRETLHDRLTGFISATESKT